MNKKIITGGRMAGKTQRAVESISKDFEKKACPIDIAFRALDEGIYFKDDDLPIGKYDVRALDRDGLVVICNMCSYAECDFTCKYSDYKKTWWLKEDMSE